MNKGEQFPFHGNDYLWLGGYSPQMPLTAFEKGLEISQCPSGATAKSLELQCDTASGSLHHHGSGIHHRE